MLARRVSSKDMISGEVCDHMPLLSISQGVFSGHSEKMPYDNSSIRSIYHIREYNIRRLSLVRTSFPCFFSSLVLSAFQLSSPSIFLSHDWPQSIEQHGDLQGLLKRKPFFRQDIATGRLGSSPLMGLLKTLKPDWWFSAHLHVRFQATVVHNGSLLSSTGNHWLLFQQQFLTLRKS